MYIYNIMLAFMFFMRREIQADVIMRLFIFCGHALERFNSLAFTECLCFLKLSYGNDIVSRLDCDIAFQSFAKKKAI